MLPNAERFFRVYSGLPLEERKMPIIVIDKEPINWDLASEYISNGTEIGQKILNILIKLKII